MNHNFITPLFTLHAQRFTFLVAAIFITTLTAFNIGEVEIFSDFDWFDVIGEGGITLMTLLWAIFILITRPQGKVTDLLFYGLLFMHISMLLDFLDEFLAYPESAWITTIESLPAPIGMLMTTFGLYHWYQELKTINNQLRRTERFYREHSLNDFVTGCYSAEYMKKHIEHELKYIKANNGTFSLVLFDIKDFSHFNLTHGHQQGDNLLREVAQIIMMNVRDCDLTCRYASDRFIVLMPNTCSQTATEIAEQVNQAIAHLAFKTDDSSTAHYIQSYHGIEQYRSWHQLGDILTSLNQQLLNSKNAHEHKKCA